MVRGHVLPCAQQEREDSSLLWLLQQCIPQKAEKRKSRQSDTLYYIARGEFKRIPEELARLIQKIYEVDSLICAKCQGKNSSAFSARAPISCGISCASKNPVFCY